MTGRRVIALVLPLAVLGLVAYGRIGPPPGPAGVVSAGLTQNDCRRCHAAVFQEWETSYHSRAWSDDNVQAMFQHFGFDRKCQSCHAPEPVLASGLASPPVLRTADVQSGVNCLSCHALPDGQGVAAARSVDGAPCRPQAHPAIASSQSCAGCHVAIYQDWHSSRYRREGKNCQTCHMPAVAGRDGGRSHICLGGHDEALVRSGAKMDCRVDRQELVVRVTNHATGHNFPGERHNRMLYLQVIQTAAQGEIALARQELIKGVTPFRGETSAEKIKVDETVEVRFPIVVPATAADVRLMYRAFPWLNDRQSLIVHQMGVKLDRAGDAPE